MGGGSSVVVPPPLSSVQGAVQSGIRLGQGLENNVGSSHPFSLKELFRHHFSSKSLNYNENQNRTIRNSRDVSLSRLAVPCIQGNPSTDYRYMKKIGYGGFSVVHKGIALNETHQRVAIKEIDTSKLTKKQLSDLTREMNILSQLTHPGIVKLFCVYTTKTKTYLVMECLRGGELLDAICEREYYTEGDARRIMLQLTSAVDYIHSRNVIHRDIKPENIILESNSIYSNVKLVDFGLAIISTESFSKHSRHLSGTSGYIAPEILRGGQYSRAGDVWSLGIMLYILLSGAMPFDGKQESKILAAKYPLPAYLFNNVSDAAKDLISKILVANPYDRYTAMQVLHHPWMQLPITSGPSSKGFPLGQSMDMNDPFNGEKRYEDSSFSDRDPSVLSEFRDGIDSSNVSPKNQRTLSFFDESTTHKDIDISQNLPELRKLKASQRWRTAVALVLESVRKQKLANENLSLHPVNRVGTKDSGTPRTDLSLSPHNVGTPKNHYVSTGTSNNSFRFNGGMTPRSICTTPRSNANSSTPRTGDSSYGMESNSKSWRWENNLSNWYILNQCSDQYVIHEYEEGEGEDDAMDGPKSRANSSHILRSITPFFSSISHDTKPNNSSDNPVLSDILTVNIDKERASRERVTISKDEKYIDLPDDDLEDITPSPATHSSVLNVGSRLSLFNPSSMDNLPTVMMTQQPSTAQLLEEVERIGMIRRTYSGRYFATDSSDSDNESSKHDKPPARSKFPLSKQNSIEKLCISDSIISVVDQQKENSGKDRSLFIDKYKSTKNQAVSYDSEVPRLTTDYSFGSSENSSLSCIVLGDISRGATLSQYEMIAKAAEGKTCH